MISEGKRNIKVTEWAERICIEAPKTPLTDIKGALEILNGYLCVPPLREEVMNQILSSVARAEVKRRLR